MVGQLADERYISLTTFRRDGSTASTPVWVVSDDGERLLVWTGASTWKVKRIRRDPRVLVAASDYRGRERGPRVEAQARVLGPEAEELVDPAAAQQVRLATAWARATGPTSAAAPPRAGARLRLSGAQVTSSSRAFSR